MLIKLTLTSLLVISQAWSSSDQEIASAKKISCPSAEVALRNSPGRSLEEYADYLKGQNIKLVTRNMNPQYLEQFLFEYHKFPLVLREEFIKVGARIHLIQGDGVADDPSFKRDQAISQHLVKDKNKTFDGRDWSRVPGAGGAFFSKGKSPTRIVVNRLYEGHGSINLLLHEHAHSLDSLYGRKVLSNSTAWKEISANQLVQQFIKKYCGEYCAQNRDESFAEMFALYHGCDASRQQLERLVPVAANYFRNLKDVKNIYETRLAEENPQYQKVPTAGERLEQIKGLINRSK